MARWVQFGCFSPFLRLHSSDSPFNTREPWAFSRECQDVCAKFLRLRHRLIPYLYSANVVASRTFKSLVEPVYYDHPDRSEAYQFRNQYSFGPSLLVIPVVSASSQVTKLGQTRGWLPPGKWVDILDDSLVYEGDRVLSFYRALDEYPVLAKEGAIIPLDAATGSDIPNGCPTPDAIEILLAVGADGSYDLYEDDGSGVEFDNVKLSTTPIRYSQANGTLTIGPTENPLLERRSYSVRLLACSAAGSKVEVDGFAIDSPLSTGDGSDRIIHIGSPSTTSTITVTLHAPSPQMVASDRKAHIFDRLRRAHMEILVKEALWNAIKGLDEGAGADMRVISRLNAIEGQDEIKRVIMELL